jgi:hypothetical protein
VGLQLLLLLQFFEVELEEVDLLVDAVVEDLSMLEFTWIHFECGN